ncbi:energy-coupling factor transporter transmembrane protein EcfT [Elusimicrobium posterum]|uniref:hypothetical protein n=1 Tax=Elusimicrobium posterum TaxID=3116653 RepID=UPI003C72ED17
MTIRRIFFIALIHFAVMVCFPYYGQGGFSYGILSCIIWSVFAILIGVVVTILGLEQWRRFNLTITLALLLVCAWYILNQYPQEDKISPMKKIFNGDFPKGKDVAAGLEHFGINIKSAKGVVDNTLKNAGDMKDFQKRLDQAID